MSQLIQLPGEQWAELRPPEDVSERLRRPISGALRKVDSEVLAQIGEVARMKDGPEKEKAAVEAAGLASDADAEALNMANDLGIVALVAKWSFPQPVSLDSVLDLPAKAYDALRAAVGPGVNALFMDASPNPEPASPFVSSPDSSSPSEVPTLETSPPSGALSASSASAFP